MTATVIQHPGEVRWENRLLAVVTAILVAFGLATLYSAASFGSGTTEVLKQLSAAAIGGVAMLVASRVEYGRWRNWSWWLLGGTFLLLLLVMTPGTEAIAPRINGARRWIRVPGMSFQPSELARFVIVVWVAALATKKGPLIRDFRRGMLPVLSVLGVMSLLVLIQPNLSMATVIGLSGGVVLFAAGARIGHFLMLSVAVVFGGVAAIMSEEFRFNRVKCFLGLAGDCARDVGMQVNQATIGFGSGRLVGVGFGEGQLKMDYLPMASSDFLMSTIGEEWGFLGVMVLLALFGLFCWLGFRIALTAADQFGQLLAAGITASIGFTTLMHMAVNTNLMPTTGLTLPFMSAGRSSLMVSLLAVGVLINIGRMRGRPVGRS
ncbi:MAG: cell division protein FtsW [Gemmatimonadetes bacterium]|nr:cell division protein FtsW [Gemmatimonadota bacterium]